MSEPREFLRKWAQRIEDLINGLGTGDVTGASPSVVDHIAIFSSTTGKALGSVPVSISTAGSITVPALATVDGRDLSVDATARIAHTSSSSNPHGTTKAQVGLGSVTNDAQLKRSADDWSGFSAKATPVSADLLLLEDSAAAGAKKKVAFSDLVSTSQLVQTYSSYLASNYTGATDVFTTIAAMDIAVTITAGDILLIQASHAADLSSTTVSQLIRILVDGVTVSKGTRMPGGNVAFPGAVMVQARVTGLSAGAHTVHVQSRTTNNGISFICSPVARPDTDHVSLVVKRVRI